MEHDSKDPKGKIGKYNEIPVKQREHYYDRDETDKDIQKNFGDMLAGLKDMNKKFKKEADKGETPKLNIDLGEGLLQKAKWLNNIKMATSEFEDYKTNGGRAKDLEKFLKIAIDQVNNGKTLARGRDVAANEK